MIIRQATTAEIPWINARYDELEFVHSDFDNEFIAIVDTDTGKAGIGRLINVEENIRELGGMYVADTHRKQGIARKIVMFLLEQSTPAETVYCVAFDHLVDFYKSCGFENAQHPEKAPAKVTAKADWCQSKYPQKTTLLAINEEAFISI